MKEIKVITVKDGTPKVEKIMDDLKTLQGIVGGYIEIPYISEQLANKGIDIIINEEGKLEGLKPSFVVVGKGGEVIDVICGNVIFTSHDKKGNQQGLTKSQFIYLLDVVNTRGIIEMGEEEYNCGIIKF